MIEAQTVNVSTSAVRLDVVPSNQVGGRSMIMKLDTGSDTVYLGDSEVTSSTGWPWLVTDGALSLEFGSNEELWAICGTGDSATVKILHQGI